MKKIILLFGMLFVFPVFAAVTLDFGVYTTDKPTTVYNQLRPILNIIEKNMSEMVGESVDINIHMAHTYEDGVDHLVRGKVDFSRLGSVAYIMSKRINPSVKIIAVESFNGKKEVNGIIAVHELSDVRKIEDLEGLTFAFGSEKSTIGRYLSQRYLYMKGITSDDLKKYEYLNRHDRVGIAIGLGKFDAGALKESTFNKLKSKGVPIREIARFKNGNNTWVARGNLPEEIYETLQKSMLNINISPTMKTLNVDKFVKGNDIDYEEIRDAMENNKKFFDSP